MNLFERSSVGLVHQGVARLTERQMVRGSDLSGIVARRFRTQDQDAGVPEPVKEQCQRYADDEKTY